MQSALRGTQSDVPETDDYQNYDPDDVNTYSEYCVADLESFAEQYTKLVGQPRAKAQLIRTYTSWRDEIVDHGRSLYFWEWWNAQQRADQDARVMAARDAEYVCSNLNASLDFLTTVFKIEGRLTDYGWTRMWYPRMWEQDYHKWNRLVRQAKPLTERSKCVESRKLNLELMLYTSIFNSGWSILSTKLILMLRSRKARIIEAGVCDRRKEFKRIYPNIVVPYNRAPNVHEAAFLPAVEKMLRSHDATIPVTLHRLLSANGGIQKDMESAVEEFEDALRNALYDKLPASKFSKIGILEQAKTILQCSKCDQMVHASAALAHTHTCEANTQTMSADWDWKLYNGQELDIALKALGLRLDAPQSAIEGGRFACLCFDPTIPSSFTFLELVSSLWSALLQS